MRFSFEIVCKVARPSQILFPLAAILQKIVLKNLFKRKTEQRQLITVVEYKKKYCFETYFRIETGLWKRTDLINFVDKSISEQEIGELILERLNLSKTVVEKRTDFEKMYGNYKKITKLSSIKKQMNDSKSVQITKENDKITFIPTKNGGTQGNNKGYHEIPEEKIITKDFDPNNLGKIFLKSLNDCE